ncbi:hypothetical protein TWF281_011482 [Arthrobotrys megalospora]
MYSLVSTMEFLIQSFRNLIGNPEETDITRPASGPAPVSYLLSTPVEICREVLGHLDVSDIGNFAICSKTCRDIAFPLLLASIKLCPDSVVAFILEDGPFYSLRSCVRNIRVVPLRRRYGDDTKAFIENFCFCLQSLHIFSSTTSVDLEYDFEYSLPSWNNLYVALWRTISALPNLKEITFRIARPSGFQTSNQYSTVKRLSNDEFHSSLSLECRQFLGPALLSEQETEVKALEAYPKYLETFRVHAYTLQLPAFHRSFLTASLVETLRCLYIHTEYPRADKDDGNSNNNDDEAGALIFPNLESLRIYGVSGNYKQLLSWCIKSCPNLKDFVFHVEIYFRPIVAGQAMADEQGDGEEYKRLSELHNLTTLSVQWPEDRKGSYSTLKLEDIIRHLVTTTAGAEGLQKVEFIRIPPWGDRDTFIIRECRITRDGEGGLELHWKVRCVGSEVEYLVGGEEDEAD